MNVRTVIIFAAISLAGCIEERYRWNITHAQVTPWTHLTQSDREAVIHLVSSRDAMPIIGISEHRPGKERGDTISVYTGDANANSYDDTWHVYDLRKEAKGTWRVVDVSPVSHTVAGMDLGGMFHELEKQRSNQSLQPTAGRRE